MLGIFESLVLVQMQRFKNFWRSSADKKEQQSPNLLERTHNLLSTSFRRTSTPQYETTIEFDDYLTSLPSNYINIQKQPKKRKNSISTTTLKPQLLKRCYARLDPQYLSSQYQVTQEFFQNNRLINLQRQTSMHQQLDEVEICLFNQITSRFDEIMSVLLTIRSLECLVVDNQQKLRDIRSNFLDSMTKITQKQRNGAKKSLRIKNIQKTQAIINQLKQKSGNLENIGSLSQYHKVHFIQCLLHLYKLQEQVHRYLDRNWLANYKKIPSTKNIENILETYEEDIRENFSNTFNTKIYDYVCQYDPKDHQALNGYDKRFWKSLKVSRNAFEDAHSNSADVSMNDSAFLNESMMEGDGDDGTQWTFKPLLDVQIQDAIIQYFNNCWNEGMFDGEGLRKMFSKNLRQTHSNFLNDCRDFCDEVCREFNKHSENPSLTNLLNEFTFDFCVKLYTYFVNIHKNLLLRMFSIANKILNFAAYKSNYEDELTIEQRQKLSLLTQGTINTCGYLLRIIILKSCQIVELKPFHTGIDVPQFKSIMDVMTVFQEFIQQKLMKHLDIKNIKCKEQSFLYMMIVEANEKIPLQMLKQQKNDKLLKHLARIHKSSLEEELKDALEEEIWEPVEIQTFFYDTFHFLMTGQFLNLRRNRNQIQSKENSVSFNFEKSVLGEGQGQSFMMKSSIGKTKQIADFRIIRNQIIISNKMYKVTEALLLLVEILEDYVLYAKTFPQIKKEIGLKLSEMFRSYNSSSCQLIVHAGAIALGKLKSRNITARHLALSYLCLSFLVALSQYEPIKSLFYAFSQNQYGEQTDQQFCKIMKSIEEHSNKILIKLEDVLKMKITSFIKNINFIGENREIPTKGTQGIISNTKILYDILLEYFDDSTLKKVFTPQILSNYCKGIRTQSIGFIKTRIQAEGLKDDISYFFSEMEHMGFHRILGSEVIGQYRLKAEDVMREVFESLQN